ncbi:MAG: hypothetical protein HQK52_12305 [Oligoflexia bacterium]|nr:hypothetical protein [Oligoflexia bacterium]
MISQKAIVYADPQCQVAIGYIRRGSIIPITKETHTSLTSYRPPDRVIPVITQKKIAFVKYSDISLSKRDLQNHKP